MKVLIITFGSLGDVQPYVVLGKGLQAAGHMVTICTASRFESFITDMGCDVIEHSSIWQAPSPGWKMPLDLILSTVFVPS
jgi:UDP:flavonoid glycosyltransferase YjiC (YdhE family)